MECSAVLKKLEEARQLHLVDEWERLSEEQRQGLLQQIDRFDPALFAQQRAHLVAGPPPLPPFEPYTGYDFVSEEEAPLSEMGTLLLAGGEGSRLRFPLPKGCYPISVVCEKSLFQLFAEKVAAASEREGRPLPLAIMTSEKNHKETIAFFEERGRFGLDRDQLSFFSQASYPLLNSNGDLFLEDRGRIAFGSNGNGMALHHFVRSGLFEEWQQRGVRHLNMLLVDNPLADPCDARLLAYHLKRGCDVTLKCTERTSPDEKVGVVVETKEGIRVVEYSELPPDSGDLRCANLSLFCFSFDFIARLVRDVPILPLHVSRKAARHLAPDGQSRLSKRAEYWKFEHFIFDVLAYAHSSSVLLYPRAEVFAPLKGAESVALVRDGLLRRDQQVLASITGQEVDPGVELELAQEFYYPTEALLAKWRGQPTRGGYILSK